MSCCNASREKAQETQTVNVREFSLYLHGKHGLQLEYLNTHDGHGCNELTLRRPG